MQPPHLGTAKLVDTLVHNDKFIQYYFENLEPAELTFQAGQYISLKVSERGDRRSYSLCSSPTKTHGFELLVDISPRGLGSTYLAELPIGATVNTLGPLGVFTMPVAADESAVVYIATGSGIAPFRSMLLDQLQTKKDQRPIWLYWGMRHENQLFWLEEMEELSKSFANFHFHPVISQALPEWSLCRGRVTDCLNIHALPENAGFYLCGNAAMIGDVMQLLTTKGVPADHIHHEKFY